MSLEDIFAEFPARLGPDVKFAGPRDRDVHSSPPRIAWVPVTGQLDPPRRLNDGEKSPIYTRVLSFSVEIWGETLTEAHELADLFLSAAHDLLSTHGLRPGLEQWDPGGISSRGFVIRSTIALMMPVLRTARPARTVTLTPTYRLDDTTV